MAETRIVEHSIGVTVGGASDPAEPYVVPISKVALEQIGSAQGDIKAVRISARASSPFAVYLVHGVDQGEALTALTIPVWYMSEVVNPEAVKAVAESVWKGDDVHVLQIEFPHCHLRAKEEAGLFAVFGFSTRVEQSILVQFTVHVIPGWMPVITNLGGKRVATSEGSAHLGAFFSAAAKYGDIRWNSAGKSSSRAKSVTISPTGKIHVQHGKGVTKKKTHKKKRVIRYSKTGERCLKGVNKITGMCRKTCKRPKVWSKKKQRCVSSKKHKKGKKKGKKGKKAVSKKKKAEAEAKTYPRSSLAELQSLPTA